MRKIFLLGLLLFTLTFMGCNQNELEVYKEANIKTDTIQYAKAKTEINLRVELANDLPEDIEEFRTFLEHITYINDTMFDKKVNSIIVRQFLGTSTFGIDSVYYNNMGDEFIKIPFLGKYIKLEDFGVFESEMFSDVNFEEPPVTKETIDSISNLWIELVNKEDVINLGNEVVDTPEGEVKVKKLVVTFKDEQLKGFLNQALDIIKNDEKFRIEIINYPIFNVTDNVTENGELITFDTPQSEVDPDEIIKYSKKNIDSMVFDEFKVTIYIDIDDYIVNEEFEISVSFKGVLTEFIESVKFESFYQLYDIGEKIEFSFPELNEDNTTTLEKALEEFNYDIPFND